MEECMDIELRDSAYMIYKICGENANLQYKWTEGSEIRAVDLRGFHVPADKINVRQRAVRT